MIRIAVLMLCIVLPTISFAQPPGTAPTTAPAKLPFSIGRDTTYITSPLDADGVPDYVAALNAEFSKGVTAENNAAIGMLEVIGLAEGLSPAAREQARRLLALPEGADKGLLNLEFDAVPREEIETALKGPWQESSLPRLAEYLRTNQAALDKFVQACRKSKFWMPQGGPEKEYPWHMSLAFGLPAKTRSAAKLLLARAMLQAGRGNAAQSHADWVAVLRLGNLERQSPLLIHNLVGMATTRLAATGAPELLAAWKLSGVQARTLLRELNSLPVACPIERVISVGERAFDGDFLTRLARGDLKSFFESYPQFLADRIVIRKIGTVDWDEVLRHYNREMDADIACLRKPTFAQRYAEISRPFWDRPGAESAPSVPHPRTIELLDTKALIEALDSLAMDPDVCLRAGMMAELDDMRLVIVSLAVAAEGYRAEHQKYPESLSALVPQFVPVVPMDICSGKPLIYRVEGQGYILYSVGRNMKDDGGTEDPEDPMNEIVLRMPPTAPSKADDGP